MVGPAQDSPLLILYSFLPLSLRLCTVSYGGKEGNTAFMDKGNYASGVNH